jgi:hypothetical protein
VTLEVENMVHVVLMYDGQLERELKTTDEAFERLSEHPTAVTWLYVHVYDRDQIMTIVQRLCQFLRSTSSLRILTLRNFVWNADTTLVLVEGLETSPSVSELRLVRCKVQEEAVVRWKDFMRHQSAIQQLAVTDCSSHGNDSLGRKIGQIVAVASPSLKVLVFRSDWNLRPGACTGRNGCDDLTGLLQKIADAPFLHRLVLRELSPEELSALCHQLPKFTALRHLTVVVTGQSVSFYSRFCPRYESSLLDALRLNRSLHTFDAGTRMADFITGAERPFFRERSLRRMLAYGERNQYLRELLKQKTSDSQGYGATALMRLILLPSLFRVSETYDAPKGHILRVSYTFIGLLNSSNSIGPLAYTARHLANSV